MVKKKKKKHIYKPEFIELLDEHVSAVKKLDERMDVSYKIKRHEGRKSAYAVIVSACLDGWKGPRTMFPEDIRNTLRLDIDLMNVDKAKADSFLAKNFGKLIEHYIGYLKIEEYTTEDVSYIS